MIVNAESVRLSIVADLVGSKRPGRMSVHARKRQLHPAAFWQVVELHEQRVEPFQDRANGLSV
jgi:hypothetical protein